METKKPLGDIRKRLFIEERQNVQLTRHFLDDMRLFTKLSTIVEGIKHKKTSK